ncbi:MAG: phage holin family protein [Candidatus Paceibacterota bacterium]|jgi:putative membrane protein
MFKLIKKFVVLVLTTWLGVYACQKIFPEITITKELKTLLMFLAVFSALTLVIKPILDILLKPLMILTLGLLSIIVNMMIVLVANNFTKALTIDNNFTLFKVTFIIGLIGFAVNLVIGLNSD